LWWEGNTGATDLGRVLRPGSLLRMAKVLLLVDVQKNMLLPPTPVPGASVVASAIEEVLGRARSAGAIVVHIRNNGSEGDPDAPASPGWELVYEVRDGEQIVDKHEPDAFVGTRS
jgi:nicotinamidase-related amidase